LSNSPETLPVLPAFLATNLWIDNPALQLSFPIVAANLLRIAIAAQPASDVRVCPDPANLFIDILAKVGYVEDTTAIVESRVS
jgi:hypothetical protein